MDVDKRINKFYIKEKKIYKEKKWKFIKMEGERNFVVEMEREERIKDEVK
jgi:hypothetical protein